MNNLYYKEMLKKDRLIPIYRKGRMVGFITFYITNDIQEIVNSDSWSVLEDNSQGKICYLAQVCTDKDKRNAKLSYSVWRDFRKFILKQFPSVEAFYGRRWDRKNSTLKEYMKKVNKVNIENECCMV